MLVGRAAETGLIQGLLDAAQAGTSAALVVEGEAGIGKSALLHYAVERSAGMRVLTTRGVESESEIPFSGLSDLLRPILDHLARIPPPQAAALAGALALGPPQPGDRYAIFAATFSLLVAASETAPVLGIVDDAHWLDASSAEALMFSSRRLGAEGIVLLFAMRTGEGRMLSSSGITSRQLEGLDRAAAANLLSRQGARQVSAAVSDRLFALTRGNPLALIEIPSFLSDAQLAGTDPFQEPLRVGAGIERAFLHRVADLPESCRRALLLAAASDSGDMAVILHAAHADGLAADAFEPAESAEIIVIDAGILNWRHPLLRAAVYQGVPPADRRAAHRLLSDALRGSAVSDRRAWHLAAAAAAPDETVASALEQAALDARQRTAHAAAAAAFERAARLSPGSSERAHRYLEAARDAQIVGNAETALRLLDEALAIADEPLLRADIQHLKGGILMWSGNPKMARVVLLEEAARIEPLDTTRAAMMTAEATVACTMVGDVPAAVRTARRVVEHVGPTDSPARVAAEGLLCNALILAGEATTARPLLVRCRALFGEGALGGLLTNGTLVQAAGHGSIWVEDYDAAALVLHRVVEETRAVHAVALLAFPVALLAELHFRTGRWNAAFAEASESTRLAAETGQLSLLAFSHACLAIIEAARGMEDSCRSNTRRALDLAERFGVDSILVYAGSALGLLALGLGQFGVAIAHLEEVARLVEGDELGEPTVVEWAPDLIEAYIRAGRRSDASSTLTTFERQASKTQRNWALATASRCRGLLAPDDSFEPHFLTALDLHRRTPTPFEMARTELSYGQRLRRVGSRLEARDILRSALATFEQLGAAPWAANARRELDAAGAPVSRALVSATVRLTPQEMQVALRVAEGAANKEIAAALFLSAKTIEFHLGNVYRKLGLHSRSALASLLAREGTVGAIKQTVRLSS
jgi:DNA-binding CsgD family transcriptional regulator